ncbi:hypothetical protein V8F33_004839 [Rhypophila sp. PSN 637]
MSDSETETIPKAATSPGINFTILNGNDFWFENKPLPVWTKEQLEKNEKWTAHEMTSLVLHAILEDGKPTRKWQPIVDKFGVRSIKIPTIVHVRYYQTISCALFLFAPNSGSEACVACKKRPRNEPATECVYPGGPFGGNTCINCMYKAKTTLCRAPQPTVNMKDLAAAGDILFPKYRSPLRHGGTGEDPVQLECSDQRSAEVHSQRQGHKPHRQAPEDCLS